MGRILILADAAHSIGARYNGRMSGSLTDVSVFSFHAVKNLTTAEGGGICLNLPEFDLQEIYSKLCIKALHGQNKDALAKTQKGNWKYDIVEAGYKWNMTDIQASIGLIGLKHYDDRTLTRRRRIFESYTKAFEQKEWAVLPIYHSKHVESSYHLYPLRIKGITEEQRDQIIQLIFDKDVSVNVHFPPLPLLSAYKALGYEMSDYPMALDHYKSEISLPVYFNLSDDNVQTVIQAVSSSVEEVIS